MQEFYIGWHQPVNGLSGCGDFPRCMVSVNRLLRRRSPFPVQSWILDSGAFTRIAGGQGHLPLEDYAKEIRRWAKNGNLVAAVAQDYMCEPFILGKTGLTIQDHQRLTIENYDRLLALNTGVYIMPVLQGYSPADYVRHLHDYGDRLRPGQWVGVGSVCKRNSNPGAIEAVLVAIKTARPDLRLHGFGVKKTALESSIVWDLLYSADSQAHSFAARMENRNANCPKVALNYAKGIGSPLQASIFSAF